MSHSNPEKGVPFIENKEEPKERGNAIDDDFNYLEGEGVTELSLEERIPFIIDTFDTVFNPPLHGFNSYEEYVRYVEVESGGKIKHYLLPDIPGGESGGDINTIREGCDWRVRYKKTQERMFVRVGQGEMWVIPKKENPYFLISMSECSAIIGFNNENMVIAHISYSAINETEAVMEFMRDNNIPLENIHVVASVGKYQEERSREEYTKRVVNKEFYTNLGIPDSHIQTFGYIPRDRTARGMVQTNLTQIIGNPNELLKYSFDLEHVVHHGLSGRDEKVEDYRDVTAVPLVLGV